MQIKKRLFYVLLVIFNVVMLGSLGYYILFNGSYRFMDCVFMTVISLTTVGYGEIIQVRGNVTAEIFTMILITFGMGVILYGISTLTALIIEGELSGILRKNKMDKSFMTGLISDLKKIIHYIEKEDDTIKILRIHLLIEELLEEYIRSRLKNPDAIDWSRLYYQG